MPSPNADNSFTGVTCINQPPKSLTAKSTVSTIMLPGLSAVFTSSPSLHLIGFEKHFLQAWLNQF